MPIRERLVLLLALLALVLRCEASSLKAAGRGASSSLFRRKLQFDMFKKDYHRSYASADEEAFRLGVFIENMDRADKLTQDNPLAIFGVNEFADVTRDEFKRYHNAEKYYAERKKNLVDDATTAVGNVTAIDWRELGAVTYVKNQGQCGSCWSFSVTGNIEGQWYLGGNDLVAVSEQFLVSCDSNCSGCDGCWMDWAFDWIVKNHSGNMYTEASYPYVSGGGVAPACNTTGAVFGAQITGYVDLPQFEPQMAQWCAQNGPISIGVDATSFQSYISGIITNCVSEQVDHGVLIVGFNLESHGFFEPAYWIIKNSWGKSWGEDGFLRVAYGSDQCLITSHVSSSTVHRNPTPQPAPPTPAPPTPPPTPSPPLPPNTWSNLFGVPYDNLPSSMSGISCTSLKNCYVASAMANGGGNFVFQFNGELQGEFNPLSLASQPLWFSAITVGGTDANPKGVVGGSGIGNGLQYFANSSAFVVSSGEFFVNAVDLRSSPSGQHILGTDSDLPLGVLSSSSAGASFVAVPVTSSVPSNCTAVQYTAMPSENVWYVTLGSTPNSAPISSSSFAERQKRQHDAKGDFGSSSSSQGSGSDNYTNPCFYTAVVAKTTDGGKTWANVFVASNSTFSLSGIDCANNTHCVAVGSGQTGGLIYQTTDGTNFKLVYSWDNADSLTHTISKVRFASSSSVWAAATQTYLLWSSLVLLHSTNGGSTWNVESTNIANLTSLTDLTFTEGGVGFATATLSSGAYTILRYQP